MPYKFNFGISLVYGPDQMAQSLKGLPREVFSGLEISGQSVENESVLQKLGGAGFAVSNIRNVFDSSLTSIISEQPDRIAEDFRTRFSSFCEKAAECGASTLTMDFGFDSAFEKPIIEAPRIEFVKSLAPLIHNADFRLLLPVRIPSAPGSSAVFYNSIIRKVMSDRVRLSIDIYPHEIVRGFQPDEALRPYRFTMELLRLVYEPEAGNILVEKTIRQWLEPLAALDYDGTVVFCPKMKDPASFTNEASRLAGILRTLL